jgi:hypothetical protein
MVNGKIRNIQVAIIGLSLSLVLDKNKEQRQLVTVEAWDGYTGKTDENGNVVLWFSPKQLTRIASSVGCETSNALKTVIDATVQSSMLSFDVMECLDGEPVIGDDGQELPDGSTYTQDWLKVMKLTYAVSLSAKARELVLHTAQQLDMQEALAARKDRANAIEEFKSPRGVFKRKEKGETPDPNASANVGGATPPVTSLTKLEMKRANQDATAQGKAKPFTTAQVNAGA